jgi:hypothetical protein
MSTAAVGRPVSTTVVAVIAFIQGIIATLVGIGLIIERDNDALIEQIGQSSGTLQAYGWATLIWGVLALLVGFGLWGGANWARIVVAILQALHVGGGIYLLFAWNGHYFWQGIWQILVGLFVLWLLFNPRSEQFFAGR